MSNINDKATVSLFVNGEQAEAAMKRLSDKAQDLNKKPQVFYYAPLKWAVPFLSRLNFESAHKSLTCRRLSAFLSG